MISFLLTCVLTSINPSFQTGDTTPLKKSIYSVVVNTNTFGTSSFYLQGINDSSFRMVVRPHPYGHPRFDKSLSYQDINHVSINRKGSVGRGALVGGLGGLAAGGIAGAISYTPCYNCILDFGASLAILAGATIGLLIGGIAGLILGSRKHKFAINGNKENFEEMRAKLLRTYGINKSS